MKIVRKVLRVFFIISLVSVCLFSIYILYDELSRFGQNSLERLQQDPSLFILVFAALLSIVSLFFNLEKIAENRKKSNIYKITRIGDIIFSLYFFGLGIAAAYSFFKMVKRSHDMNFEFTQRLLPIVIMSFMFLLSILLFIDNILFHKSFKKMPKDESIEDIGKQDAIPKI